MLIRKVVTKFKSLKKDYQDNIFMVIGSILGTISLLLGLLSSVHFFLGHELNLFLCIFFSFFLMMLECFLLIIYAPDEKNSKRLMIIGIAYGVCSLISIFGIINSIAYIVVSILIITAILVNQAYLLFSKRSRRSLILNSLIMFLFILLYVLLFTITPFHKFDITTSIILGFSIAILSFIYIISFIFHKMKATSLFKILRNTYSFEIFYGLLIFIVATSVVLQAFEPKLENFGDALWFCFAVVTTIGFGDLTCTSFVGRIMTVLLGIYGIVVVALITSIIVNLYNESRHKKEEENIDHISEVEQKQIEIQDKKIEQQDKQIEKLEKIIAESLEEIKKLTKQNDKLQEKELEDKEKEK